MTQLRAKDLTAGYDGPPIVQSVSVSVASGRLAVILGANGAGKSTLIKTIVGAVPASAGHVYLDDKDVTGLRPFELVRLRVGYLPQLLNVFDELSVIENLEMGAYTLKGGFDHRLKSIQELFPELAGPNLVKRAGQLSGGQQRMLALARTLVADPQVLLLDEPTAGLSPAYAQRVWDQIGLIRDRGIGLLVVEQNVKAAIERADHAYVMSNGRLILEGAAREVAANQELASLFVG